MLGRFGLQRIIRDMVKEGCTHAIVETSSEGILQHRHAFIDYRVAVFTNLSPEHIERHGSFEAYRDAKSKLFERVSIRKDGVGVYNLDDEAAGKFLQLPIAAQYGYSLGHPTVVPRGIKKSLIAEDLTLTEKGTDFKVDGERLETPLIGKFNAYNALAAAVTSYAIGISWEMIRKGLSKDTVVSGRFQRIHCGQPFEVIIDYAHEPKSLEAVYEAVKLLKPKRIVGLLGSQGGGRDRSKRGVMGEVAATTLFSRTRIRMMRIRRQS
jgi:UDP-N-acetylmuramyl tripeptide synthase